MSNGNDFTKFISRFPNGTKFYFYFNDGVEVLCKLDTMYETDNGLEIADPLYEEYYAAAVEIIEVIKNKNEINLFKVGQLTEVSNKNSPKWIKSLDSKVIWSR
ncbi:hypothetical protein [Heyndrickxia oleronia]|uniref:Uncharacterized protein n=1 Tax=Heyndrickxia oleronia TaxID=38875 RepID=A0AAW6SXY5_9BACI|nr:hypothetical protein [Heyndrickxia oleronia]MDH5161802.1 hypothetical protein [Heyndrickxia oleronia]